MFPALAGDGAPEPVMAAARSGLQSFLSLIPPHDLGQYGFAEGDRLADAVPGEPYRARRLRPSELDAADTNPGAGLSVADLGMWYFPVFLDGTVRSVLIVDSVNGEWRAVSLGLACLAPDLDALEKSRAGKAGRRPELVIVPQSGRFFFTLPDGPRGNLTELGPVRPVERLDGRPVKDRDYMKLTTLANIVPGLNREVKMHLRVGKERK